MGQSFYICSLCREIFSDYWEYIFCEDCYAPICDTCRDEYELFEPLGWEDNHPDEEWMLLECPACDQFRHMTKEYEY